MEASVDHGAPGDIDGLVAVKLDLSHAVHARAEVSHAGGILGGTSFSGAGK
jgi:hypothetical protein